MKADCLPFAHEQSLLVPGQKYRVAHAVLNNTDADGEWLIPVFPHWHMDKQFVQLHHFHIDGRWPMNSALRSAFEIENGRSNKAVFEKQGDSYVRFHPTGETRYKTLTYNGKNGTGFNFPSEMPRSFTEFYASMVGKKINCKKCPHYGTIMQEKEGGYLVCPMHNLVAKNNKIIQLAEVPREFFGRKNQ